MIEKIILFVHLVTTTIVWANWLRYGFIWRVKENG